MKPGVCSGDLGGALATLRRVATLLDPVRQSEAVVASNSTIGSFVYKGADFGRLIRMVSPTCISPA